jgi:hypothetical protein
MALNAISYVEFTPLGVWNAAHSFSIGNSDCGRIIRLDPLETVVTPVPIFNRSNGPIGSNWSGSTSGYAINGNALDVGSGGDIYWVASSYGSDQEAYVTFTTIDGNAEEINLILKAQGSLWDAGILEAYYNPSNHTASVWTYESSQGWVKHGGDISVTFSNGDEFGARAYADGTVEVYKNGSLVGTRDVSSWSDHANGGRIGLWMVNANDMVLDDFGGGELSSSGPTPTPTQTPDLPSFPQTGVQDNFNRANGPIGSNWAGETSDYLIASNRLEVDTHGGEILWQPSAYGADQEAWQSPIAHVHHN